MSSKNLGLVVYKHEGDTIISKIVEKKLWGFKLSDFWPEEYFLNGNFWNYQIARNNKVDDPIQNFTLTECRTVEEVKDQYPEFFL